MRRRTVQERIRSGKKNGGCRAQEENAGEPSKRKGPPRKIEEFEEKARHPQQTAPAHATKRERWAKRLATEKRPSTCSSRDAGSTGRTAWNRSTACSADPVPWPTYSRRTVRTVSPPRPAQQMSFSGPSLQTLRALDAPSQERIQGTFVATDCGAQWRSLRGEDVNSQRD